MFFFRSENILNFAFFFRGPNNSDSVVFANADHREIKDHSLTTTPFQKKKFCYESSRYVSMMAY